MRYYLIFFVYFVGISTSIARGIDLKQKTDSGITLLICGTWSAYLSYQLNKKPAIRIYTGLDHQFPDRNNLFEEYPLTFRQDSFYVAIHVNQPSCYLSLRFAPKISAKFLSSDYLITGSDTIHIAIDPAGNLLLKKARASFRCQFELRQIKSYLYRPLFRRDLSTPLTVDELIGLIYRYDARGDSLLTGYAGEIAPSELRLIRENYQFFIRCYICNQIDVCLGYLSDVHLISVYNAITNSPAFTDLGLQKSAIESADLGFSGLEFFLRYSRLKSQLLTSIKEGKITKKHSFQDHYQIIRDSITPLLRDKLFPALFKSNFSARDASDSLRRAKLEEAIGLCRDPASILELKKLYALKLPGSRAYPFVLPDTVGHLVSLSDFGGRLVVLHFWFTGCVPCQLLHRSIAPLMEKYRDDPGVAFVSICIDPTTKTFLKSVKSGLYTSPNEINLFAEGKGMRSEVLQYYGIHAFPRMLLIDGERKLISADPPSAFKAEGLVAFETLLKNNL